jgi:hypothetical protein
MPLRRLLPTALAVMTLGASAVVPHAQASPVPHDQTAPAPQRAFDQRAFTGLSTWVDGYDYARELTARPSVTPASVRAMKARGVRTIWLQATKTSPKVRGTMMSPDRVGAILRAAHGQGIRVVAWYLPTFEDPAVDWRKTSALVQFASAGQRFDGFALDIESTRGPVGTRNARLVALSRQLRAATTRPVAAVVLPPVLTEIVHPGYWGGAFPWLSLRSSYDVWMPMGYYTAYRKWPAWRNAARSTAEDIKRVRKHLKSPVPIAYAGGLAADSTPADYDGFARAARAAGALGTSAYDYASTPSWAWAHLRAGAPKAR